jgi:hypothetical protein
VVGPPAGWYFEALDPRDGGSGLVGSRLSAVRRLGAAVLIAIIVATAEGCAGSGRSPSTDRSDTPWAPPSPSYSPPPSHFLSPIDVTPQPLTPRGVPACGFVTSVSNIDGKQIMLIRLGVAIGPSPLDADHSPVTVAYHYTDPVPGYTGSGTKVSMQYDNNGTIVNGDSFTPAGSSVRYVTVLAPVPIAYYENLVKNWLTMDKGWDAWFKQTQTVTVTVDPNNQFDDTNKANNTVTLKIKPTKRLNLDITDNTCEVVR